VNINLLSLYGLKCNPFSQELPTEAIFIPARIEEFCWRIEQVLVREGGFAMIQGDPGSGKSVVMRLLAHRLARERELTVGSINHPNCNLADFYREMGDVFGVPLRPHNRWGGFKALREPWITHLHNNARRTVLLIDEAQELSPAVLNELRLLAIDRFDSHPLLCVVLAGDARLAEKLRHEDLLPVGSRIRTRLRIERITNEELFACVQHLCAVCGNPALMTDELARTLCDHAAGNYRVLFNMAAELLTVAAKRELPQLNQKLYLEVFAAPTTSAPRRAARR
jgi:general secretion pathway protein A